jgi:hypothetical protein
MSQPGTSAPAAAFSRMRTTTKLIIMTALVAASGGAIAQAPPAPATPPQATAPPSPIRANNCAPTEHSDGTIAPKGATTGQAREPLGDKLAKSDGVLCPPGGVDPEMRAAPPDTGGNTPVIPPPGSPGGDPTVRPK